MTVVVAVDAAEMAAAAVAAMAGGSDNTYTGATRQGAVPADGIVDGAATCPWPTVL